MTTSRLIVPSTADIARERASTVLGKRMVGLDILRGVAILAVLAYHGLAASAPLFPWKDATANLWFHWTAGGWAGVNLFFVLSGFLITGNLIDSAGRPNFYSRFYWRRALRILPLYLVVLILLRLTGLTSWKAFAVSLLFLSNVQGLFGLQIATFPTLWSLAVEEQFYLLWPVAVRWLRTRGVVLLCLFFLAACPVLRYLSASGRLAMGEVSSKPWFIADNLCVGALLALLARSPRLTLRSFRWLGAFMLGAGTMGLVALAVCRQPIQTSAAGLSLGYTCIDVAGGGLMVLLLVLLRARTVPRPWLLVVFFGDISYGLYLLHQPCLDLYDRWAGQGFLTHAGLLWVRFFFAYGAAVLLATASRRWFEVPMQTLRSRMGAD